MNSLGLMTELNTSPTASGIETEAAAAVKEGSEVRQDERELEKETDETLYISTSKVSDA